jgi:hypothetical protein
MRISDAGWIIGVACWIALVAGCGGASDTAGGAGGPGSGGEGGGEASTASSSGSSVGSGGASSSSSGAGGEAPKRSYMADVEPIFRKNCQGCHFVTDKPPRIFEDVTYGVLLETMPTVTDLPYVAPGSPEGSYLWHKIVGTHLEVGGDGLRMPYKKTPLGAADTAVVEEWIRGGALP